MSQGNDLSPPQDAGVEIETIGFDFGPALKAGEFITGVVSLTATADAGFDPAAQSRLGGSSTIVASNATAAPNGQVNTQIGGVLGGVNYKIQCVVNTNLNQTLSLYTHLLGNDPI